MLRLFSPLKYCFQLVLLLSFIAIFQQVQAAEVLNQQEVNLDTFKAQANFIQSKPAQKTDKTKSDAKYLDVQINTAKGYVDLQRLKGKSWDFSHYHGLKVELQNTSQKRITPAINLTSSNSSKWQFVDSSIYLEPGETKQLLVPFLITSDDFKHRYPQFEKMNAGPSSLMSSWKGIDLTKVNNIRFSLLHEKGHEYVYEKELSDKNSTSKINFIIKSISPYTLEQFYDLPKEPSFPFVDKLGQYLQANYPNKLTNEKQWQQREQQELEDLNANKGPQDRSKWGGWLKGPKQKSTGNFYTTKIADKWWLVDPEGYLFWSHGVTGVGHKGANTLTAGRSHYFKNLPSKWGEFSNFHDNGRFDFTQANLYRKYGKNWQEITTKRNHQRLKSWGMNTYGNWSQPENFGKEKTPFTVAVHYKSKMLEEKFPDPWDKNFSNKIKQSLIAKKRDEQADSPWNIGFFVDNELHFKHEAYFSDIIVRADKKQPAKLYFAHYLKDKYQNIAQLNQNWQTNFSSFESLLANKKAIAYKRFKEDADWFYQQMVDRYYRICRDSVKEVFPNHLYLGSRVHGDTQFYVQLKNMPMSLPIISIIVI